jgi:hypothetical protein
MSTENSYNFEKQPDNWNPAVTDIEKQRFGLNDIEQRQETRLEELGIRDRVIDRYETEHPEATDPQNLMLPADRDTVIVKVGVTRRPVNDPVTGKLVEKQPALYIKIIFYDENGELDFVGDEFPLYEKKGDEYSPWLNFEEIDAVHEMIDEKEAARFKVIENPANAHIPKLPNLKPSLVDVEEFPSIRQP